MRIFLIGIFGLLFLTAVPAQRQLDGRWVGTLTEGNKEYYFELRISKQGRQLTARTSVHLNDTTVVEMQAKGIWHDDRSFNLQDTELLQPAGGDPEIFFIRNYQLLFRRSFNDYYMKGWWQEKNKNYNDKKRRLGRIYLEKVTDSKA